MTSSDLDRAHMRSALALARRGLGSTWPNPSVGCVIVQNGRVVGRATTGPGGRPHAETQALGQAGAAAHGATAYVTLEPCSHQGQTPPCADALIAAGVARVVVAGADPDPRVDGRGLARLREAGLMVEAGLLAAEADALQAGFLTRVRLGRPMITLKLATTLDGRIATAAGESRWITGAEARRAAHAMRGDHDAVLVGIGTALADDPALTCRIEGLRRRPEVRVVLDRTLRLPASGVLARTAREKPVWVVHAAGAASPALVQAGVVLLEAGRGTAAEALAALGQAGLTRVLVEGGAAVAGALLEADLVDRLAWFHAPGVLGHEGWPAARLAVPALSDMRRFGRVAAGARGADWLSEFERRSSDE